MKHFWTFVGITIVAIILALVVWSYARGKTFCINDYLNWTRVVIIQVNEIKTDIILANPKDEDVVFVVITIINGEEIFFYTFIGDDINIFASTPDGFIDMKPSQKKKDKVWQKMRIRINLYKL